MGGGGGGGGGVVGWTCNVFHMKEAGDEQRISALFLVEPLVYLSSKISGRLYSAVFLASTVLKLFFTKICSWCKIAMEFV